jgi:hypothetical protein
VADFVSEARGTRTLKKAAAIPLLIYTNTQEKSMPGWLGIPEYQLAFLGFREGECHYELNSTGTTIGAGPLSTKPFGWLPSVP